MMAMDNLYVDAKAFKFLLKLLSFPNYRAPLSKIKPTPKMKAAERNKICGELCDRQWVACSEEINKIMISDRGKYLIKNQTQENLNSDELQVLQASLTDWISPGKTGIGPEVRSETIDSLVNRDLLKIETEVKEVWLTESGKLFLVKDYNPHRHSGNLSFKMLADYLQLIREFKQPAVDIENVIEKPSQSSDRVQSFAQTKSPSPSEQYILQAIRELDFHLGNMTQIKQSHPSDEEILQIIQELDHDLRTENYLPIFHLRERLQSSESREIIDQALYRLQAQNKIQLKSLEEVLHYNPEYFEASIPQKTGWALFFIVLNPEKNQ
jgi:hypothetical protein